MKADLNRLRHMLEAAREATRFVQGRQRSDLDSDRMLFLSLLHLLSVLGEAAKAVSEEVRNHYPQVAWKEIAGTRDRLIHHYFDVNKDIVWQIVTSDLPSLVVELEKVTPEE
jgi:uncharacterized protein with HEPN domain